MTLHRSRRAALALVVLIVVLLLFRSGAAQAGGSAGSPPLGAWLAPDGMPPPAIVYDAVGRCLSAPHCPDREQLKRLLERYERNYGQRLAGERPPTAPPARREVAPTPAAQIQPAYREASQVRPEFAHVGEPLAAPPPAPARAKGNRAPAAIPAGGGLGSSGERPVAKAVTRAAPASTARGKAVDRPVVAARGSAQVAAAARAPGRKAR